AGVLDPELRRDEELVARDPACRDRTPDCLFVQVGGGGVERAVASLDRCGDGSLGLLRRDLVDAEPEGWHLDAVVQPYGWNGCCAHLSVLSVLLLLRRRARAVPRRALLR